MIGNIENPAFSGQVRLDSAKEARGPRSLKELDELDVSSGSGRFTLNTDELDLSEEYRSIAVVEEASPLEKTGDKALHVRMNGAELYELLSGRSSKDADGRQRQVISAASSEYEKYNSIERMGFIDKTSVSAMFLNTMEVKLEISQWAMHGNYESKIAEHIGNIGKRLDTAYAEGKFTKAEYDELCKGLDDYATELTTRTKRSEHTLQLIREEQVPGGSLFGLSGQDLVETRRSMTDEYFRKNPIDMTEIFRMIYAIRYGTVKL